MEDNMIRYTLRTDKVLFRKFRYVAEYEGRSANKEIEQFIKRRVAEFEKEHGKISITDLMTRDRQKKLPRGAFSFGGKSPL